MLCGVCDKIDGVAIHCLSVGLGECAVIARQMLLEATCARTAPWGTEAVHNHKHKYSVIFRKLEMW